MTIDEIIQRLERERAEALKLQAQIHASAQGRFMTQDEDADQSYLEGKIVTCEYSLMMLKGAQ